MSLYSKRGVSSQKEEVHAAIRNLDPGLYPKAFCKIYPDFLGNDSSWVNLMHADGAGSKSVLAYLYWKETGDNSVWKGIAQDAIVMNLDDLLCVGIYDNLLFSSTIDRNKNLVPGEILSAIIEGSREFIEKMRAFGVNIHFMGGETADVGDVARTIAVNGTMMARWPKDRLITNEKISPGNVIIGLAGFGKANYESDENSGIASNGLTSARHDLLSKFYARNYPESFDPALEENVVYSGSHRLTDAIPSSTPGQSIGKLLLSPTRTFAPVIKEILEKHFQSVYGLIHCSGGGQTKCLKYIPDNTMVVKDDLFNPPLIFTLIQQSSKADDREMYQVFNMGTRMEIYTNETDAPLLIAISRKYGIEAKLIGKVEKRDGRKLIIKTQGNILEF